MPGHEPVHQAEESEGPGRAPRPPSTLVARERLLAALDRGAESPLTMLIAPPGTGKTVLLSDWFARRRKSGGSVLWVPGQEPQVLDKALIEERFDVTSPAATLIVDDAHLLPLGTIAALARVLTDRPQAVRLVLASRYDLPLPVAELELRGIASTLRFRDLRFTDTEAAELVHAHADRASAADVWLLQEKTAGWAAALMLGARAIATSCDDGPPAFTEQPVLDLLLGDTLNTLEPRVLSMLLSTFGSTAMTGRLAAVLSGDAAADALLADLASNGLLVTAYAEEGGDTLYHYHPLLVELLRRRVVHSPEAARLAVAAQHRVAQYHENRGEAGPALRCAIDAQDPALVGRMLLSHGPAVLAGGDVALVAAAFDSLPGGHLDDHPQLVGVRGLLRRLAGDVTGAVLDAASAAQARSDLAGSPIATPDYEALAADAALLRLWESRYGWFDLTEAIRLARSVLGAETGDGPLRRTVLAPPRLSWLLVELAGAELRANQLPAAHVHLDEALMTAQVAGHPQLTAAALSHLALVQLTLGRPESAARSARSVLDTLDGIDSFEDSAARATAVLGIAALTQLDLDEARRRYASLPGETAVGSDLVIAALRLRLGVSLLIEDGRLDQAVLELAQDPASDVALPSFVARDLALLRCWIAVLIGDDDLVATQVGVLERHGHPADAELIRAVGPALTGGAPPDLTAIDTALARPGLHPLLAAGAASVRTVMLLRLGDDDAAETSLLELLNRVAGQRVLQPLSQAAQEPDFLKLLQRYVQDPSAHPFAGILLEAFSESRDRWSAAGRVTVLSRDLPAPAPPPRRLDAVVSEARIRLTAREADVLDQAALGGSYAEIARALYITENTVKTHLVSLYRKLGVDKRSAALRVARDVGLL